MSEEYIEFSAPCCYSSRECRTRRRLVIDVQNKKVIGVAWAVRCNRGVERKFKTRANNAVVEAYVSNRGNLYITIIYLPSGVDKGEVEKIAKGYLGFYEEGVI